MSRIPGARIGHGPQHPQTPDQSPEPELTDFLATYPAARADNGYVEFLKRYGGASIENPDATQIVDILGFTDASTKMNEMDGPVVDEDGFLLIAQCIYHSIEGGKLCDTQEHDFALDATGKRKPGIYRLFSSLTVRNNQYEWCAPDFVSWLNWLVGQNGTVPPSTE